MVLRGNDVDPEDAQAGAVPSAGQTRIIFLHRQIQATTPPSGMVVQLLGHRYYIEE